MDYERGAQRSARCALPVQEASAYAVGASRSHTRIFSKTFLFCPFFFSSRRRHTRLVSDWSSDVCSSDLMIRRPPRSTPFPWRARGGGVPTLGEVLERYPFTPLLVELKVVEAAEPVRRLLLEHGAEDRTIVASFLEGALQPFREAAIPTAASRGGITALWLRTLVGLGAPRIPDRVYAVPDRYKDRLHVPTAGFLRAPPPGGAPGP